MPKVKVMVKNNQTEVRVPVGIRMLIRRCCQAVLVAEHFGQDCQIDPLKLRAGKKFCCLGDIAKFISIYMCLKNCSFYNCHIIIPLLLQRKLSICHIGAG